MKSASGTVGADQYGKLIPKELANFHLGGEFKPEIYVGEHALPQGAAVPA